MRSRRTRSGRSIRPRARALGRRWPRPTAPTGSLAIRQQAWLRGVRLGEGESVDVALDPARQYWLHVAQGAIDVDGRALTAGDALGFVDEAGTHRCRGAAPDPADVLFFDLPA